jgi:hypothetical protein
MTTQPPGDLPDRSCLPVAVERSGSQGSDPVWLLRRWFEDRLIDTRHP